MKRGRRAKVDLRAGLAILADRIGAAEVVVAAEKAEAAGANGFRMRTTASLRGSHANHAGNRDARCSLAATAWAAPGSACEETL